MLTTNSPTIIGPTDGESVALQTIGVRFMIPGADTGSRFSLVEHPIPPRALAAPLHRHNREDEYSFVLAGRMGALLGDDVVEAGPGDLVYKPRGQWHTCWNAGDEPARILEIIAPAGFEHFFAELVDMGGVLKADPADVNALGDRYGLEMKPETVPELLDRFGLVVGEPLESALVLG
jgi:mannose-6-phosphate isomerase-like protein (cupin superfamily)